MKPHNCLIAVIAFVSIYGCTTPGTLKQTPSYMEKYKTRVSPGNQLTDAGAIFTVERTPDLHYIRKEYYFETGQKTSETYYADPKTTVREGKSVTWYDNGNKWMEGQYKRDKMDGEWKYYDSDRAEKLSSYGMCVNGLKEGLWIGLDSLGNKSYETMYKAGERVGETKYFHPDGTVRTDFPSMSASIDDIQIEPGFTCNPKFASDKEKCGETSLMNYLATTIQYPALAREEGIMGTALLTFVVDKDGSIRQVTVLRGICDGIRNECLRVVKNMPRWNPGMVNDKPVKVRFTLPIRFRLE